MRKRLMVGLVAGSLVVAMGVPAMAQDDPSPVPSDTAAEAPSAQSPASAAGIADLLPQEIGGVTTETGVTRGEELFASYDPDDPDDAAEIERMLQFVDEAGSSVDGTTRVTATAFDDTYFASFFGMHLLGASEETLLPLFLAQVAEDIGDPIQETVDLGSKSATKLYREEAPDQAVYVYGSGESLWLLNGPEDDLAAFLATLP
jgi:hypothetical protein